jgi:hypothetical protein
MREDRMNRTEEERTGLDRIRKEREVRTGQNKDRRGKQQDRTVQERRRRTGQDRSPAWAVAASYRLDRGPAPWRPLWPPHPYWRPSTY